MKFITWIFTFLLLHTWCGPAQAQNHVATAHRSNTQIIDFLVGLEEKTVVDVAEAMPEERYGFAPGSGEIRGEFRGGEFRGVRTFAAQLKHIAADNYMLGAAILGEKSPGDTGPGESGSSKVQTKAEIIAYLKASFAYMHRAAAAIDDANAPVATPDISPWPDGTATRMGLGVEDLVHTYDHYGQLVEYLRMNGITPPASAPKSKQ